MVEPSTSARLSALGLILKRRAIRTWSSKCDQEQRHSAKELFQLFSSADAGALDDEAVGDIARLITRRPGVEEIKHCVGSSVYPALPVQGSSLRGEIWQVLLNVFKRNQHGSAAQEFERMVARLSKLPRDPLLVAECTLVSQLLASSDDDQAQKQQDIETMLVWFLTTKSIMYSSGMARVVAPFFTLNLPLPTIYDCFYQYCAQFLPHFMSNESVYGTYLDKSNEVSSVPIVHVFTESEKRARQQLVEQLLCYHDPQLGLFLSQWCPEEWSRPGELIPSDFFLMNVYRVFPPRTFVHVIDQYLFTGDRNFGLFVLIAVFISQRDHLMQQVSADSIRNLIKDLFDSSEFEADDRVRFLCVSAARLRLRTPRSYMCLQAENRDARSQTRRAMDVSFYEESPDEAGFPSEKSSSSTIDMSEWQKRESRSFAGKIFWYHTPSGKTQWEHPAEKFQQPPALFALPIGAEEVAVQVMGEKNTPENEIKSNIHFFVVDCRALRSSDDLKSGRIPAAFTLDPSVFDSPELIAKNLEAFNPMKNFVHVVLVGHGVGVPPELITSEDLKTSVRDAVRHDIDYLNRAALFFQKRGFRYVSILDGGYSSWHSFMRDSAICTPDELLGHATSECHYCRYDTILETGEDPFKTREQENRGRRKKASMPTVTNLPVNGGEGDPSIISTSNLNGSSSGSISGAPSPGSRLSFTLSRNSFSSVQKKLSEVKIPKLPQWGRRSSSSAPSSQIASDVDLKRSNSSSSQTASTAEPSSERGSSTTEESSEQRSDNVIKQQSELNATPAVTIPSPKERKKSFVGVFTIDYSDDEDEEESNDQASSSDQVDSTNAAAPTLTA